MVALKRGHLPGVGVFEEGQEEVLLVLEVRVHRALRESGGGRHFVEGRCVEAALGEDLGSSLEQVLTGLLAPAFCGERFEWHRACATSQYSEYYSV